MWIVAFATELIPARVLRSVILPAVTAALLVALSVSTPAQQAHDAKVANYSTGKFGAKDYEHFSFWAEKGKRAKITYSYGAKAYDKPDIALQYEGVGTYQGQSCFKVKFPNGLLLHVMLVGQRLRLVDEAGKYDKIFAWEYEGPIDGRGTFCTPCVDEEDAPGFIKTYFLQQTAPPQARVPQFKDYPVSEIYADQAAPLVLTKEGKTFQTKLREAAQGKPNFAGRYILTAWGCGTSCLMGAVIDAKTGKVHWFPHTICCWGFGVDDKFRPIEFRLESRLIVFSGERNEKEGDNGAHFYKFENGSFIHIRSVKKEAQNR